MNKFFATLTMFAVVAGFSACGGGDDETGVQLPETPNNPELPNTPEVPETPEDELSKYPNRATSAEGLTLAATHLFIQAGDTTSVKFVVYKDGENVTENASIYQIVNGVDRKVNDAKAVCSELGTHTFWASYKGNNTKKDALLTVTTVNVLPELEADAQPSSSDFFHRALIVQGTGVGCQYCPNAIGALHKFFANEENTENAILMAVHTYNTGDPLYSNGAETLSRLAGFSTYPVIKLNFDNNYMISGLSEDYFLRFLNENVAEICTSEAETNIAVSTSYNEETGVISVAAKVKCDDPGMYKVTAALVQDNVFFPQTGTSNPDYYLHEAGVKDIAPASGLGFALNNGEATEEGKAYDFFCEFNANSLYDKGTGDYTLDVARDARIIVYVQANGNVVDNTVSCGMNQKVGFTYNK